MTIRPCTISEIESSGLSEEYSDYAVEGLPKPNVQWERYKVMETAGIISSYGAFVNDVMVGFITCMVSISLHYGVKTLIVESIFVASQYRSTGAGLKLIRMAEQSARDHNAGGVVITASFDKELDHVLPKMGYAQTHAVYFKGL